MSKMASFLNKILLTTPQSEFSGRLSALNHFICGALAVDGSF